MTAAVKSASIFTYDSLRDPYEKSIFAGGSRKDEGKRWRRRCRMDLADAGGGHFGFFDFFCDIFVFACGRVKDPRPAKCKNQF